MAHAQMYRLDFGDLLLQPILDLRIQMDLVTNFQSMGIQSGEPATQNDQFLVRLSTERARYRVTRSCTTLSCQSRPTFVKMLHQFQVLHSLATRRPEGLSESNEQPDLANILYGTIPQLQPP